GSTREAGRSPEAVRVPEHDGSSRQGDGGEPEAVWGEGHRVEVAVVPVEGVAEVTGRGLPDLHARAPRCNRATVRGERQRAKHRVVDGRRDPAGPGGLSASIPIPGGERSVA